MTTSASRLATSALLVLMIPLLGACGPRDYRDANVVVIAIDTLRADHVGAYGYPRPTSPRLDAFARDAVLFETAVSQSSWTTPSFASMFTGLVPSAHRAGEGQCPNESMLGDAHETLATRLRSAGYRTASFVSNAWISAEMGFARGFDEYELLRFSEEAVTRAVEWLATPPRPPFFLFVHVIDPHQPWAPTPEDAALFVDPEYRGPIGGFFIGRPAPKWTDADRRRVVDLYDGEVRWADRMAGRVFDALDERDLAKRTIVVVVSDHGEELFDHGGLGHGHTLYEELLLVPFLIRFPGASLRARVAHPVRTMDLFPTLLDAVGEPIPEGLDGVSLMPLLRTGEPPATEVALSEYPCSAPDVGLQSLRTPSEKLLFSPANDRAELFDLVLDPHERTDLAAARPDVVADLRARMTAETAPVAEGFHLVARGGSQDGTLRIRLEAPSGFHHVALLQAEAGDRMRLTRDDTVLDLELHLTMRALPLRRPDADGVRFRTGADGPIAVRTLLVDGVPLPLPQLSLGEEQPLPAAARRPLELGVGTPGIVVRRTTVPPPLRYGRPRVQVSFTRPVAAPRADITPEMRERLRAMGYVE